MKSNWAVGSCFFDIVLSIDLWTSVCICLVRVNNMQITFVDMSHGQDRQCHPFCYPTQVLEVLNIGILRGEVLREVALEAMIALTVCY